MIFVAPVPRKSASFRDSRRRERESQPGVSRNSFSTKCCRAQYKSTRLNAPSCAGTMSQRSRKRSRQKANARHSSKDLPEQDHELSAHEPPIKKSHYSHDGPSLVSVHLQYPSLKDITMILPLLDSASYFWFIHFLQALPACVPPIAEIDLPPFPRLINLKLPSEVIELILSRVNLAGVLNCAITCRRLRTVADGDRLWLSLIPRVFISQLSYYFF